MRIDGIIRREDVERKLWDKHRAQPGDVEAALESDPHLRFVERGLRRLARRRRVSCSLLINGLLRERLAS